MTDSDYWWEPPLAGTESEHLVGALDQLVHLSWGEGRQLSLRRLVCDLIEEYGRHTGHADLLREAVDGLVGEDPPAGWHPVSTPTSSATTLAQDYGVTHATIQVEPHDHQEAAAGC